MKLLIYTFRTFPFKDKLLSIDPKLSVLGRLNEDIKELFRRIDKEDPDLIIGIAASKKTQIEAKTINKFNKTKKVIPQAPDFYELDTLNHIFPISSKGTDSFCNWSIFQIKHYLKQNSIETELSFIHISAGDFNELTESLLPDIIDQRT